MLGGNVLILATFEFLAGLGFFAFLHRKSAITSNSKAFQADFSHLVFLALLLLLLLLFALCFFYLFLR
jgi:hypothetical protein